MPESPFPHLHLIQKAKGPARLEGGGGPDEAVEKNKANRRDHGEFLKEKLNSYFAIREVRDDERKRAGLPDISGGVPFLIQIPDEADEVMEFLSERLGLELVAEYDEGFLIVSADSLDLEQVLDLANDFIEEKYGAGRLASILDIDEDPFSERRIERILAPEVKQKWPFADAREFILDVSIEVAPYGTPGKPPGIRPKTSDAIREKMIGDYENAKQAYFKQWDELRLRREEELDRFIQHHNGSILQITDESHVVDFPDGFSMRIRMRGEGFTDLIKNYPNLFEVTLPDEFGHPLVPKGSVGDLAERFNLLSPDESSPAICVIDSGIQEGHRWLEAAIKTESSRCFIPGKNRNDVADYVRVGGHGTRVAGACLYPKSVPAAGEHQAPFWLLNARVLDEESLLQSTMFPADLLREVVRYYLEQCGTRIYQHSVAANTPCRMQRMSTWAAMIDQLSHFEDVLFLQCTGNLPWNGSDSNPDILRHIQAGRGYPAYLYEASSRLANPSQSLQALTVGSVSGDFYDDGDRYSMAQSSHPSAFTRIGFGMWESIKPEVVEFGGDDARDRGNPPSLTTPPDVCPELLRSTRDGGPPVSKDQVGTSFSTPKVAHIAGHLEALFPDRETLLYRALVVNSARWPEWAEQSPMEDRISILRAMGYGVPDLLRATENSATRITLISEKPHDIKAGEGFIFGIPIPHVLRRAGDDFRVRIDVTLSYSAEPRRTRKSRRGYLGVWLDWKASKRGEGFETFKARALKDEPNGDGRHDGNFRWTLGNKREKDGITDGVSRNRGTVQKDWAFANSYELPDTFGVVVRGHKGWDRRNEQATARFSLVVSFEALRGDVRIYEEIQIAIQSEVQAEQQIEVLTNS